MNEIKNTYIRKMARHLIENSRENRKWVDDGLTLEDCACSVNSHIIRLEQAIEEYKELIEWLVDRVKLEYVYQSNKYDEPYYYIRFKGDNELFDLKEYTAEYFIEKEVLWKEINEKEVMNNGI